MPAAKLTLSADTGVIALAKQQAKKEGMSISAMFSNFIRAKAKAITPASYGPMTTQLIEIGKKGKGKFPVGKSYKELLEDALVTRNAKDFPKNAMPILNPENFLALADSPQKKV